MKNKVLWGVVFCFLLGLVPPAAGGQAQEKATQMFWVYDSYVKPSMKTEYYEAGKKLVELWNKHGYPWGCETFWADDNHVMWFFPIQSFADIDRIYADSNKIQEKAPEEYQNVMAAFAGTMETEQICVVAVDIQHSLVNEGLMDEEKENDFFFSDYYYLEPGHEAELQEMFDRQAALFEGKDIVQNWYYYWSVMGYESPLLVMVARAKTPEEFYKKNAEAWDIWGEEVAAHKKKMMKFVRKEEVKTGWVMRDLFYTPKKKE